MDTNVYLVWDGQDLVMPPPLGKPRQDQLQGTHLDNLIELAGRCCYDSLGKGRNTTDYHKHLIESGHLSVHEHAVITLKIPTKSVCHFYTAACANRPGVWTRLGKKNFYVTANFRAIREWFQYPIDGALLDIGISIGKILQGEACALAPRAMEGCYCGVRGATSLVSGKVDQEIYASLFITNVSRGLTHELVRHRNAAFSQRSTRYCDESESDWIPHPSFRDEPVSMDAFGYVCDKSREAYKDIAKRTEASEVAKGADKTTARKTARGAARGVLGNALATELIMSASLWQWKQLLGKRLSPAADGEIRELAKEIEGVLKNRWPERFVSK